MPDNLITKYFYPAVAEWQEMNLEDVQEVAADMSDDQILSFLAQHFSSY